MWLPKWFTDERINMIDKTDIKNTTELVLDELKEINLTLKDISLELSEEKNKRLKNLKKEKENEITIQKKRKRERKDKYWKRGEKGNRPFKFKDGNSEIRGRIK